MVVHLAAEMDEKTADHLVVWMADWRVDWKVEKMVV